MANVGKYTIHWCFCVCKFPIILFTNNKLPKNQQFARLSKIDQNPKGKACLAPFCQGKFIVCVCIYIYIYQEYMYIYIYILYIMFFRFYLEHILQYICAVLTHGLQ